MSPRDPEDFDVYRLDDDRRRLLLDTQVECAVVWTTAEGWPVGVMHQYLWARDRFWVTCFSQKKRVVALRRRPQCCVIVTSAGTALGEAQTVTAKTVATVHDDPATKDWFFPAYAERVVPGDADRQRRFVRALHGHDRVVIELEPVQWITFDGRSMLAAIGTRGFGDGRGEPGEVRRGIDAGLKRERGR